MATPYAFRKAAIEPMRLIKASMNFPVGCQYDTGKLNFNYDRHGLMFALYLQHQFELNFGPIPELYFLHMIN